MAKTVFENSMVAHVWAQQKQDTGRSNNGQFYFSGAVLYSYGSHFVVGIILPDGTPLITRRGYSPSTGRHIRYARQAVRGGFMLPELDSFRHIYDDKPRVAAWVETNILTLDMDAAAFLLGYSGKRGDNLKQAIAMRDKAERAAKRRHEKAAKEEIANAVKLLKAVAAEPDAEFETRLQAGLAHYSPSMVLEGTINRLKNLLKSSKKQTPAPVLAVVKARMKTIAAMLEKVEAQGSNRFGQRRIVLAAIRDYRFLVAEYVKGTPTRSVDAFTMARHLDTIHSHTRGTTHSKIEALRTALQQIGYDLQDRERKAERLERARAMTERRDQWLRDETYKGHGEIIGVNGETLLRALKVERDKTGAIVAGTLETSRGATVPLTHAIKAFRFVKLCRENGRAWHANGKTLPVGHFRIDEVYENGNFRAGCHDITWQEVERLASALGVSTLAGADTTESRVPVA